MSESLGCLQIDLGALGENWSRVVSRVQPSTQVAAVVKANGYGLGVRQVANRLARQGCRVFFVASVPEAHELADVLSQAECHDSQIYVLSGARSDAELAQCHDSGFIPVLYTPEQIAGWVALNQRRSDRPCAIKVDTGMHRLGLTEPEFTRLLAAPEQLQAASPQLLMSHLACADVPEHPLNQQQLQCFQRLSEAIRPFCPEIRLSLANSFGTFLDKAYHFDLVRPGISLYGGNPQPGQDNPMAPVVSLELPIVQVKRVDGPATLGYGATYTVLPGKVMDVAIVLGGYGDGILRHLSNRAQGWVNGQSVRQVGRVSMDSMMFDVSELVAAGETLDSLQTVRLLGPEQGVDGLAQTADTISYELLTRLGNRYRRIYRPDD